MNAPLIASRFRGFLPVAVDVETGGFNPETDALLEIAAVLMDFNLNGDLVVQDCVSAHVEPFAGANMDKSSLDFIGVDPHHPLRIAESERDALTRVFKPIREKLKNTGCTRAILVGHNPAFDLSFVKAAVDRSGVKRNPFHQFSSFDTASLAGLVYGQTVLARAVQAAGMEWDNSSAHSARYDAMQTAQLFCTMVNVWREKMGGQ